MAEAARLKWSNVMLADGGNFIRISAEAAKTLRCRLIPVPIGLANYLKVVRKDDGYVYAAAKRRGCSSEGHGCFQEDFGMCGMGSRNALRASALSYPPLP